MRKHFFNFLKHFENLLPKQNFTWTVIWPKYFQVTQKEKKFVYASKHFNDKKKKKKKEQQC